MLTCLWLGPMHPTHGHLLCDELAPFCINCDVALTVLHILMGCPHYGEAYCVYHLHGVLANMLGDDCHCVSSVLALVNAICLATAI